MGNSLLAVRDINHKYIVVGGIENVHYHLKQYLGHESSMKKATGLFKTLLSWFETFILF